MSIPSTAFRDNYNLAYQISPIILLGGIAVGVEGNMLPIINLYGQNAESTDFYATFLPIPGGTVISNAIGTYPFANQQVAANAIIQQPTSISLIMIAPVRDTSGYLSKLAIFTALQNSLQNHNNAGGMYMVATPSFLYTNCLMTGMTDITSGETKQKQVQWQLDFVKPLLTKQQATAAQSALMSKLSSGAQVTTSNWSGPLTVA